LDPASGIDKPWRRNATIIYLDITLAEAQLALSKPTSIVPFLDQNTKPLSAAAAIVKYLKLYGKASVAYEDIRPRAETLNLHDHKELLEVLLNKNFDTMDDNDNFKDAGMRRTTLTPQNQDVSHKICMLLGG
jgi:N-terminal acetyltransferase B complex non-catalytic subunit